MKRNYYKPPIKIGWENNMGKWPRCPVCGEIPYSTERCTFCGQRFIQDDPEIQEYNKPPEEERRDCIFCGGHNTLVGYRAKCNGHFHGKCESCGCVIMQ